MSDDSRVERHIDKATLTNLFNTDMAAKRAAAQEMMPIASRIRGLKESHGLNPEAYRLAKAIAKKPEGEREQLKRAVDLYCDMLGVGDQADLLDDVDERVEDNVRRAGGRTETEAVMDGQGAARENADRLDAGMVGSVIRPNSAAGKTALKGFENSISEAVSADQVNDGLDRFTKDNPYLAEKAGELALMRLDQIDKAAAEEAGGEDLRSTEQREAPARQVRETVEAAKVAAKPNRRANPGAAEASVH